jgi:hypothetical protein
MKKTKKTTTRTKAASKNWKRKTKRRKKRKRIDEKIPTRMTTTKMIQGRHQQQGASSGDKSAPLLLLDPTAKEEEPLRR